MNIKCGLFLLLISTLTALGAEEMVTKTYPVDPDLFFTGIGTMATSGDEGPFEEFGAEPFTEKAIDPNKPSNLMEMFTNYGVNFPSGSSLVYDPVTAKLILKNTQENVEAFETVFNAPNEFPRNIELNGFFISFTEDELASINNASPTTDELMTLKDEGKGKQLAPFKLVTINGVNAMVESVKEYIYPTEFTVIPSDTNAVAGVRFGVQPGAFETRELGQIINFTPTVSPDNRTINLTVLLERSELVGEKDYGFDYTDKNGNTNHVPMPQPIFQSHNVTTCAIIHDGETVVLSGGHNEADQRNMFIFLTPRLIDPDGKPLPQRK
jgi:Flp pilus assembly secretin CpaC